MDRYVEIVSEMSRKYAWLSALADDFDLDASLRRKTSEIDQTAINPYRTTRFYNWMSDVSRLVEKMLSHRREFTELASSAVRQAMEYAAFEEQKTFSEELEVSSWVQSIRRTEAAGQSKTAAEFGTGGDQSALTRGFKANAESSAAVSTAAAESEDERIALVRRRWEAVSQYQEDLNARHSTPGHPFNYAERAARLHAILMEDWEQAFMKASAADIGIKKHYGISVPAKWRKVDCPTPLDEMMSWARAVIRDLEKCSLHEFEADFYTFCSVSEFSKWVPVTGLASRHFAAIGSSGRVKALAAMLKLTDAGRAKVVQAKKEYNDIKHIVTVQVLSQTDDTVCCLSYVDAEWPDQQNWYYGEDVSDLSLSGGGGGFKTAWLLNFGPLLSHAFPGVEHSDIEGVILFARVVVYRQSYGNQPTVVIE